MKTSKLNKLAWVFFALALGITTVQAQYRANRNYNTNEVEKHSCINDITGLSEDQKTQILALEEAHEKNMDVLRDKRRSTRFEDEKAAVREEMIETRVIHRNKVKELLTPDQQKQYHELHAQGNRHLHQNNQGNGSGRGNGSHQFSRKGNGKGNSSYGHVNSYSSNSCNRSQSYGNGRGRGYRL